MKKADLLANAKEAAKNIKAEHDLSQLTKMLSKIIIEAALNAELDANLGYDKNQITGSDNSRNGFTSKTMQTEDGQFEIDMPRDRNGDFEPKLVKKKSATYAFCGRQGHAFLYTRIIHARHRRHV